MSDSAVDIKLTSYEMMQSGLVGVMRQVQNLKKSRRDFNGAQKERGWQYHIEGAMGETAVAKLLDRFWSGSIGNLSAADVGKVEVRTTSRHDYSLIIHPKDNDEARFVLVTGVNGTYKIHGWIYGKDGKQERFWDDPAGGRPAYFVPQSELQPLEKLWNE